MPFNKSWRMDAFFASIVSSISHFLTELHIFTHNCKFSPRSALSMSMQHIIYSCSDLQIDLNVANSF